MQLRCSVHSRDVRSRLLAVLIPDRQRVCTYSGVTMSSTYSFWVEPKGELLVPYNYRGTTYQIMQWHLLQLLQCLFCTAAFL